METKTYHGQLDRKDWPAGPWDTEPDKMQWADVTTGLPCLAVRNRMGRWCGYVGVSETHPAFEHDYSDVDVCVHGGLTFAAFCAADGDEAGNICHVPGVGEPDHVWWLGFDCGHTTDYGPTDAKMYAQGYTCFRPLPDEAYRTLDYVRAECAKLAAQLARMS